jgi:histone deacetylase 1/2
MDLSPYATGVMLLLACFLINRLPSRTIDMKTPLERLLKETPDYTFFKVFACACWPHLRPYNNHKLEF